MAGKTHSYPIRMRWTGNTGQGTRDYRGYERAHEYSVEGKPVIPGSSDPNFRGDRTRYNPEELLVMSLSSCHMLWYLHLCADSKIAVVEYVDDASRNDGRGLRSAAVSSPTSCCVRSVTLRDRQR